MSHVDRGAGSATCQSCRKRVQSGRCGTVRRHRLPSGNYCPGGRCLSLEESVPMTAEQVAEFMAGLVRAAGGA